MNRYLAAVFWGALFYVEYRWGLTLNRAFIVVFLISATISAYYALWLLGSFLVGLKSSKLLLHPIFHYRRKLFIWVMIAGMAFYGFYRTQIPGQLEFYKATVEAKLEELSPRKESQFKRDRAAFMNVNAIENKRKKINEDLQEIPKQFESKEMLKEITTGWNTMTADTESDNFNWEKATDLVKKYPDYILDSQAHRVKATKILEEPWEYYGKVLKFSGLIYSIQQLPPEDSVAQFFDGNCYHAMIVVNDSKTAVPISAYIIGSSKGLKEDSVVSVKGYVFGQSRLTNGEGDESRGLAFVGFRE